MFEFLNQLRGRGILADIDVAFAQFIGRNADNDPALALLAALVSNISSVHGEIALPAERIDSRKSLRKHLRSLSVPEDGKQPPQGSGEPTPDLGFIETMDDWPPDPNAFPRLFSKYGSEPDNAFQPTPLILANGLYYLGRAFQNERFLRDYLLSRASTAMPSTESIPFETITRLQLGDEQKAAVAAAVNSKYLEIGRAHV